MREFLRKVWRILRWPWRLASSGSDMYTFWSLRDTVKETVLSLWGLVALALSLIASAAFGLWTSMGGLSRIFVVIIAIGAFLLVFTLLVVVFRLAAARRAKRRAEQQAEHDAAKQPTTQQRPAPTHEHAQVVPPLDERPQKIQKWRTEIYDGNFARTPHGHSQFCYTETYREMEPYLQPHVKDRLRSHHGAAVAWLRSPHLRGAEGDRRVMIGELARIEKEWGAF